MFSPAAGEGNLIMRLAARRGSSRHFRQRILIRFQKLRYQERCKSAELSRHSRIEQPLASQPQQFHLVGMKEVFVAPK